LNYMGHAATATRVAEAAPDLVCLPGDLAFDRLRTIMIEVLPQMGQCMMWNVRRSGRKNKAKLLVEEIVGSMTPHLTVVCTMPLVGVEDSVL
jgi:hypothetical protein